MYGGGPISVPIIVIIEIMGNMVIMVIVVIAVNVGSWDTDHNSSPLAAHFGSFSNPLRAATKS